MKFMTLFIEKIRKHPEFASVSANVKQTNNEKLREVLPKAEKLKSRLIELYTKEYNHHLEQERKEREQKELNKFMKKDLDDDKLKQKLRAQIDIDNNKNGASVVKPISIDTVQYPDDSSSDVRPAPSAPPEIKPSISPKVPSDIPTLENLELPRYVLIFIGFLLKIIFE